jgi:hypothetical protein
MSDLENAEYGLIVSFEDQSASYVHGYEAGMLHARMNSGQEAEIESVVHTENQETLRRMAVAYGWEAVFEPTEVEGWITVKMTKKGPPIDRPNPHGLRIVT